MSAGGIFRGVATLGNGSSLSSSNTSPANYGDAPVKFGDSLPQVSRGGSRKCFGTVYTINGKQYCVGEKKMSKKWGRTKNQKKRKTKKRKTKKRNTKKRKTRLI